MRWSCHKTEDSSLLKTTTHREIRFRLVEGNLRFPLTLTYHGCPQLSPSDTPDGQLLPGQEHLYAKFATAADQVRI